MRVRGRGRGMSMGSGRVGVGVSVAPNYLQSRRVKVIIRIGVWVARLHPDP